MDRDLQALQEVRDLVAQARGAQAQLARLNQEQIDRICAAMAQAGGLAAADLARLAVEETGMGNVPDKTVKNLFNTRDLWDAIRDMKTVGVIARDEARRVVDYAEPSGIVAGIIPCTNPTSTALFKGLISIKTRNAIVISPHPRAARCIQRTVEIMMQAGIAVGCPAGAITCISTPTLEATQDLMKQRDIAVILATGGSGLVRAAYSAGKPAYGVGPGNVPVYIDPSAQIPEAVANIIAGVTFDYGTVCASEQAVITLQSTRQQVIDEFRRQGCHFATPEEIRKLNSVCISGAIMNPASVGLSAERIAERAGITVPAGTRVILAELSGVGRDHPLSLEKLMPVLAFYAEPTQDAAFRRCLDILRLEGEGHSAGIHATDERVIQAFAEISLSSRVMVNTPTTHGAIGLTTGLFPSMSLGCGTTAGNVSSDNINPRHLFNIKRLAYGKSAAAVAGKYGTAAPAAVSGPPAAVSGPPAVASAPPAVAPAPPTTVASPAPAPISPQAYPWGQTGDMFPRFYSAQAGSAAAPPAPAASSTAVPPTPAAIQQVLAAGRVAASTPRCPVTSCPEHTKSKCTGCA